MVKACRAFTLLVAILAAVNQALRPKMKTWGATPEEHAEALPGDDLVAGAHDRSTMAATIDAPPSAIWQWLVQMGTDRAGFYSWDRLDNQGNPSATTVHSEWQDLHVGGKIVAVPGQAWFDVVELEPERTLVLRSAIELPAGRSFDPAEESPSVYVDGVWSFHLRPIGEGQTRLIVRGDGTGRPRLLNNIAGWVFFTPAHWIMQTKQFKELRRRAERGAVVSDRAAAVDGAGA